MKNIRWVCLFLFFFSFLQADDDCWQNNRKKIPIEAAAIAGWCSKDKARLIMDLVHDNRFEVCVEIGVFAGASLLPIAQTLKLNENGIVYGIDAWNPINASQGLEENFTELDWWTGLDYPWIQCHTEFLLSKYQLEKFCQIIHEPSEIAVNRFQDDSIDFIHFDGNPSAECSLQDILCYFPKIKNGGYILLDNANRYSLSLPLIFLLERCELKSPFDRSATYLLFQKNLRKCQKCEDLLHR